MNFSVAMAVRNSENFISEQLDSIIPQLKKGDEIVVSIDPSTDKTAEIVEEYSKNYPFFTVLSGDGTGLVNNFQNALKNCSNEIIFLADHDDVWVKNKAQCVLSCFKEETMVVLHDAKICDGKLNVTNQSFMDHRNSKEGFWNNLMRNSFIGCCMAFRKELLQCALPFPDNLPMHDQWIGLCGYKKGKVKFLKEPLLLYRRHGENMSGDSHSGLLQMLKWRMSLVLALLKNR